jgi:hypothetical protein
MNIAQHAERILAAWNVADPERFETALESALYSCQKRVCTNYLEIEQQELLASVVERLRRGNRSNEDAGRKSSPQGLSAGFALLQHLSHSSAA